MKNDGTYFIVTTKRESILPTEVYPFDWNGIEFFAHRYYSIVGFDSTFWQVTEKNTGYNLALQGAKTIIEAKKIAVKKLEDAGLEVIKAVINSVKEGQQPK